MQIVPICHWLYTRVPQSLLRRIEAANFIKTVRFVSEHSPFYKEAFRRRGIRAEKVRSPADLGDFYTTAEDIRTSPESFICRKPDTAFETTGTTSARPKRVYFSRSEIREAGWSGAVGLWGIGVRPEDRVASAFDYSFWVSGPVLAASCEALGAFHVEAGRLDPAEFYERLKDYRISVIVGDPSWIVRLAEIAKKKGPWPVKLLLGGGENLTEEARAFVEGVWKADFFLSYGQTEAFGAIGLESRAKEGYHLNEFHNFFEIINPDAGGWGELVYTTLNRRTMPLVRYRSGDLTRFLPPKGYPVRRIEKLKGRLDEWTPTAMGNIAPWMFEPFFKKVDGVDGDWQIVVAKRGTKDLIEFHVETANGHETLQSQVFEAFRREWPEAWRVVEMGVFLMSVCPHAKGSLKTGRKLRRIVDRRDFTQ